MFINSVGFAETTGQLYLFADDAALFNIHNVNDDIAECIRGDMKPMLEIFCERKMQLNADKTKFMILRNRRETNSSTQSN